MQKSAEAFRTISEVAESLDVPQHVLRFWESKFPQIKPLKRAGGRRYYRPDDVDLLRGIRALLYAEGYTIKGVQKVLREMGIRQVADIGRMGIQAHVRGALVPGSPGPTHRPWASAPLNALPVPSKSAPDEPFEAVGVPKTDFRAADDEAIAEADEDATGPEDEDENGDGDGDLDEDLDDEDDEDGDDDDDGDYEDDDEELDEDLDEEEKGAVQTVRPQIAHAHPGIGERAPEPGPGPIALTSAAAAERGAAAGAVVLSAQQRERLEAVLRDLSALRDRLNALTRKAAAAE